MTDVAAPVFKKRGNKSAIRKRPATPPPASDSDQDSSSNSDDDNDNEDRTRIKRQKRQGANLTTTEKNANSTRTDRDPSKTSTIYTADRSTNLATQDDATRTSNWNNSTSTSVESLEPTTARATARQQTENAKAGDGIYRGAKGYSNFIAKRPDPTAPQEDSASGQTKTVGPVKAASNVRTITVTDFAPDVCKDYKQTGFCGFGDGCKFLHAREDYKQGWQLDKDWENVAKKGAGKKGDEDSGKTEEEKLLESIPFKCVICKGDYKMPIVTKCGHYFCEKCAFTRYGKEKKKGCAQCGADTGGTFNVARKLKELLKKKQVREEEKAAAAAAEEEAG
ncbi:hypothetical protein MBLNU230_g7960t1 [Neophaeotheca triangularis]